MRVFIAVTAPAALIIGAAALFLLLLLPGYVRAADPCQPMLASWYGPGFHGRTAASGQRFDQNAMTAAHKSLPFGTKLRVSYGSKTVVVRINDRGPYHGRRQLDLSSAAAAKIGLKPAGVGTVIACRM